MNERIKDLAEQCYVYTAERTVIWFNREKFAELIILECVETLGTYEETWTHKAQMELLKKHFGVE